MRDCLGRAARVAAREARLCLAALGRVTRHSLQQRSYRQQLDRYKGMFGPWRLARDKATGVADPVAPGRLSWVDYVRANAAALVLLAVIALVAA